MDGGGGDDLVDLRAFHSDDVRVQPYDFDSNGTADSLLLGFGEDPTGFVILVGQFGPHVAGPNPGGRTEKVKVKDGIFELEPLSLAEAPARRNTALARQVADELGEGGPLP